MTFCPTAFRRAVSLIPVLFLAAACDRGESEIAVYKVAKDQAAGTQAPPMSRTAQVPETAPDAGSPPSRILGATPPEWEAQPPSQMRQASFVVKDGKGAQADISLIILGGSAGGDLENVNRWRNQLGQAAITQEQLESTGEKLDTAIGRGFLVDISGPGADENSDGRILAAVLKKDDESWFFKMRGNADLVAAQKPGFRAWVESVRLGGPAEAMPAEDHAGHDHASPDAVPIEAPPIAWNLPDGWQPAAPRPMRFASFYAPGADGEDGDVSVAVFPGDTGGDLANVNRWLAQLSLPPVDEAGLAKAITEIGGGALSLKFVDFENDGNRMLAAWTMHDGKTWFFKMTGTTATVETQAANFDAFVKSLHFH